MGKVGRRKQSLWRGSVSTEQASFVPTETISVGTKPFESPAWTEVRSLPRFYFCPDVYNSSASGYVWVFSFLVHPHGVLAERLSAGRSVCSLPIHFYPILSFWLIHSPFSVLRAGVQAMSCINEHPVIYNCASLYSGTVNGYLVPQTPGKCEWCLQRRKTGLGSLQIFLEVPHRHPFRTPAFWFGVLHFEDEMESMEETSHGGGERSKKANWVSPYSLVIVNSPCRRQFPHMLPPVQKWNGLWRTLSLILLAGEKT